jgi:uncharacterized membrane protein YgdD (TMEM256/DUF423 family)
MAPARQMSKFWLVLAAVSGLLSVSLGAFGAHSLKYLLDDYGRSIYEKAVIYQMFHTVGLFVVGLLQVYSKGISYSMAGWGFLTGILLFSGSLYLLAITGMKWLGAITPIGGIAFLFGWGCVVFALLKTNFSS